MDYLLVHGTTQSPAGWRPLAESLERRGHRVVTADLPTDQPDLLAADYARLVAAQVAGSVSEPVVVAHSASGILLPDIAAEVGASHLVWLAAVIPDLTGGRSLVEQITTDGAEIFHDEWRSLTEPPTADPVVAAYFLFHDCDLAALRYGLSTVRLFYPAAAYAEPWRERALPAASTYILPRGERAMRPEWMRAAARERLGVEAVEIDGGHCPYVAAPEEVADILTGVSGQPAEGK